MSDHIDSATSVKNTISLTPNQLGSGALPSGYKVITFTLANGNWVKDITLPRHAEHQSTVHIYSLAAWDAVVDTTEVNIPLQSLTIAEHESYTFIYDSHLKAWQISGNSVDFLTPNKTGAAIPNNPQYITFYTLGNGDWVPEVILPQYARPNSLVILSSSAEWALKVSPRNLFYASTTNLKKGDRYIFKFLGDFNKWVIDEAPIHQLDAVSAGVQMAPPIGPKTQVLFTDKSWRPAIVLPATAGDRDRIIIKSTAASVATIDAAYVNTFNLMSLSAGDQYEFFYIAENRKWEVIKYPSSFYRFHELTGGELPSISKPRTVVQVDVGSNVFLRLPVRPPENARVVVQVADGAYINVMFGSQTVLVSYGEIMVFKANHLGQWVQETITIDLLLLYSDKAAAILGREGMEQRLLEGLSLTNEALENSGANFRFRSKGIRQIAAKAHWTDLGGPTYDLRDDVVAQMWRNELKADGVYYEGTEGGDCGLAWRLASAYNMVATGSISCGTTVMRHELGHNLGVRHGGEGGDYDQGYVELKTILGGNEIPYYSTPLRYTEDYGIPLGIPGKIDAVRTMNAFSATVAAYR